jgi:hypothetical protein
LTNDHLYINIEVNKEKEGTEVRRVTGGRDAWKRKIDSSGRGDIMRGDARYSAEGVLTVCPSCHGSKGTGGIFGCKCVDNSRLLARETEKDKRKRPAGGKWGGKAMAESWLVGRKEISHYMHVSWETVRIWRREHGCPVRTGPGGRPAAFAGELDQWLVSFSRGWAKGQDDETPPEAPEFSWVASGRGARM